MSTSTSPSATSRSFLHELVRQWTSRNGSNENKTKAKKPTNGGDPGDEKELDRTQEEASHCCSRAATDRVVRLPDPTPTTPMGLKPRRSIASLKTTLDIVAAKEEGEAGEDDDSAYASRRRVSAASASTIPSPVVSTGSFYGSTIASVSRSSSLSRGISSTTQQQRVAASPVLLPGHARTAVGALVAESAAAIENSSGSIGYLPQPTIDSASRSPLRGSTSTAACDNNRDLLNQSLQSILPPFDDVDNYQYSGRSRRYGNINGGGSQSPSPQPPLFGAQDDEDVVDTFRRPLLGGGAPPPRRLMSHPIIDAEPAAAPAPAFSRSAVESLSPVRIGRASPKSVSPSNSIVASPSSLADALRRPMRTDIIDAECRDDRPDDSALDGEDSEERFRSGEYGNPAPAGVGVGTFNPAERTFQKQKFTNQRQAHEDLILAALERLQDEQELVGEIQRQLGLMSACEPPSAPPTERFLSGMPTETAQRISSTLVQILQELDVTEQLLFSSPSDAAAVTVPRNDFRDAIRFCLQLVRMSTTSSTAATSGGGAASESAHPQEVSKWRLLPEIKASLGLIPESPKVVHRGGDTSVFSMPCDDSVATPMTSNVSISTTITTRTHLTASNLLSSPGRHDHPPPRFHHQALEVRHTIATVASLLDRMSRLLAREDNKLPTQEIKRLYLEMQTLDISALKCVVESFELDQPDSLLMLLSGSASQDDDLSDVPPPRVTTTAGHRPDVAPPPLPESVAQRRVQPDKFFSPVLRSQSGNRLGEGRDDEVPSAAEKGASQSTAAQEDKKQPRAAGRRGGARRGNPFRRTSLKLQDPLNFA